MLKETTLGTLQILHLEDNSYDVDCARLALEREGLVCTLRRVESRTEFVDALQDGGWDVILSDYSLPAFDGLKALGLARELAPTVPFILFSGTIGEETAVEFVKKGASDYIIKERPTRLASAIAQAVKEARRRQQLKKAEQELIRSEDQKKHLEAQCLRMQRMESIGALVGGIAHDLNNALVPIVMGADLLEAEPLSPTARNMLATMRASARRGAEMVRHVLAFARGVESASTSIRVEFLIREMKRIVQDVFPKNIQCRMRAASDLWPVSGSSTQLHQVLMNLCVNARDAMPDGGILTLLAENATVDEDQARLHPGCLPGRYVKVSVTDTGVGMSAEVLERIFQPFFSTKDPSRGTGLGLSTTLNIVRAHGGFINVKSQPGQGATFSIHLPAAMSAEVAEHLARQSQLPTGKGELIMVVDDESAVCEITKATLENYGYRVVTAPGGPEAVAAFADQRHDIQLVITDAQMPFMDGRSTCLALRRIKPDVKIIAVSGSIYDHADTDTQFTANVSAFIEKPYTAEKLLVTVGKVLHSPAPVRNAAEPV